MGTHLVGIPEEQLGAQGLAGLDAEGAAVDAAALARLARWPILAGALQADLRLEDLGELLDLIPTPVLLATNAAGTLIRSNSAGRALFEVAARGNVSQSADSSDRPKFTVYREGAIVPPSELPMQMAAATGRAIRGSLCELRFDNGYVKFIRGSVDPIIGREGDVIGSIGVFFDATEQIELERRAALLQEEVKHRAKNCLQMVHGLAQLTLKPYVPRAQFGSFLQRLTNLGRAMTLPGDIAAQAVQIESVVREVLGGLSVDRGAVDVEGPQVALVSAFATSLNLVLHELSTNAIKYGALSAPAGRVGITWCLAGQGGLLLRWRERGGPPVKPPTQAGFGTRLVRQLIDATPGCSLEATFDPSGFACELAIAREHLLVSGDG